jgi:hypothetical protein
LLSFPGFVVSTIWAKDRLGPAAELRPKPLCLIVIEAALLDLLLQ